MNTNQFHIMYAGPRGVQHPGLRILFATGAGVVFGFQNWRLVRYGFALSLPWYGSAVIMLTYLLLGLAIGATTWRPHWLRGVFLGSVFGLGTAFAGIGAGLNWFPYGAAAVVVATVAGFLIALITDAVFP
jgi:hypothetical protein